MKHRYSLDSVRTGEVPESPGRSTAGVSWYWPRSLGGGVKIAGHRVRLCNGTREPIPNGRDGADQLVVVMITCESRKERR
ncbi:MAG: hypothetical protein ACNA8K_16955, partial [Cyclonatronaceae bacterium]